MPFLNPESGEMQLSDALRLRARMPLNEALTAYEALTGRSAVVDDGPEPLLCFPVCPVEGGAVAPVCCFHGGALHSVLLWAYQADGARGPAEARRALLFRLIGQTDPAPGRVVSIRFPFGTAIAAADPHTGDALLRLTYR